MMWLTTEPGIRLLVTNVQKCARNLTNVCEDFSYSIYFLCASGARPRRCLCGGLVRRIPQRPTRPPMMMAQSISTKMFVRCLDMWNQRCIRIVSVCDDGSNGGGQHSRKRLFTASKSFRIFLRFSLRVCFVPPMESLFPPPKSPFYPLFRVFFPAILLRHHRYARSPRCRNREGAQKVARGFPLRRAQTLLNPPQ